jgi:methionyl-tRNA formyltransferase
MKIFFYGTPDFAAHVLKCIVDAGFNVAGVVTAPDKPAGRGLKNQQSSVKLLATELNLPVFQPTNLKSEAFAEILKEFQPDVQVVVAFRMMPESVWGFPAKGTFNLHASLLPDYRGAAPIQHALINGEKETGVTTFFLDREIDTGKIILQKKVAIEPNEILGELYHKLMLAGGELVVETLKLIEFGNVQTQAQILTGKENHAPKIFPEDCEIDWSKPAIAIHNLVRGLSPFPGARTNYQGKNCKIFRTAIVSDEAIKLKAGEWLSEKSRLLIGTGDGQCLSVLELQQEGKKRLDIKAFLAGFKIL